MHWLEALDTALFHFINGSLSNPFFDWIMPILSGGNGVMHWFVLAAVLAFAAAMVLGGARARLCAIMILLVVALGDGLIVNMIKHAVHRPRPCMALSDVVERLGCTTSGSMPSAHAANWFSATMIVFIFYGRRLWLMLPVLFMAVAVAFSRVYNGVHYPGDVLAGAILGAGYAAALAVLLQWAWQTAGRACFPIWYARMPSLLNPATLAQVSKPAVPPISKSASRPNAGDRSYSPRLTEPGRADLPAGHAEGDAEADASHWLLLGCILIVLSLIGRWIYIASGVIELSGDEAYQWLWSKHLALSYYSKPPGIALIQFAGTSLWGDTELGVRFFSPLFAAILSWMVFVFVAREAGYRLAFWVLVILTAIPLLQAGAILMTVDPPLVLCWMWAIIAGWRAVQPAGQTRDWAIVGIAMGLAFLCKPSAFYQIVCFAIFFALWPPVRAQLRRSGPWLALGIFLLCTLPVIIWNWENGWATLHHVAGNAGLDSKWKPTFRYFWEFLGAEAGLLNPIFFIAAIWAAVGAWRRRAEQPLLLYLFCMSWPVLLGHVLYSFHSRILPNWIAPAVPAMFLLMAIYWHERLRAGARFVKPLLAVGLALGILVELPMYDSDLIGKIAGADLPGPVDPLHRARAWNSAAQIAETEREKLETPGKLAFIIADGYEITGELSFYSPEAHKAVALKMPLVYCVDSDTPENQFYFWPDYNYRAVRQGENAIYVEDMGPGKLEPGWAGKWLRQPDSVGIKIPEPEAPPPRMVGEFEKVEDLGVFVARYHGRQFHQLHLWACYNLK